MDGTTFISFAPNCEDVVLFRALKGVSAGRYVDWGNEPAAGLSATKAFYDRGWSGRLIRADPAQAALLAATRPRDEVVSTAAMPANPVHVLRVGPGAGVLGQLDLAGSMPWIVVVPDDARGAGGLLAALGYTETLFDGISRFHLAPAHRGLAPLLAAPANARDGFLRAADLAQGERLSGLRAALDAEQARSAHGAQRQRDAVAAAVAARSDVAKQFAEAAWLRGLIEEARTGAASERSQASWLRERLDAAQEQLLQQGSLLSARAEEAAWLRDCLRNAEADTRQAAEQTRHAHERIAVLEQEAARRAWREDAARLLKAPVRAVRRRLLPAPPALPAPLPEPVPAPPLPVPPPELAPVAVEPEPPVPVPRPLAPLPAPEPVPEPDPALPRAGPVAVVHQFHAGSAVGDAITNAMLLIRAELRRAGFRSEIFVETVGAGLEAEVLPLATLPRHAGFVLLLHHSMGYPGFDEVLALPAAKILMYHNITPPALLADVPVNQALAVRGRSQLAALRGHVTAALADSEYNAVELRRLGFQAARPCTLLFDPAATLRAATGLRPDDGVFTVLFVGRVTPSKGQAELVDAFALFHAALGRPSRLVLVGGLELDEGHFIAEIERRIDAAGLGHAVHLPGKVTDGELREWYRQADLFVSLSHHEGFGVPLVEAMAHGVPVIAWPAAAIPFTLGGHGTLLSSRAPAAVAQAMLQVAARGRVAGADGPDALARFALADQMAILLEALALAGAVPPPGRERRAALAANLQLTITGHVAKSYSLASVNRGLARTVEALRPGTVRLRPVEGAPTNDLHEVPNGERGFVSALAGRDAPDSGPELVLSGHYPVFVPEDRGDLLAALFFWEESLVPADTVALLNARFDAVFAPSPFVAKVLVESGTTIPVVTIGQAPELGALLALPDRRAAGTPFCFLHVSSAFPRKGIDLLLAAWARAFGSGDAVRLVLKTFPNPHNDTADRLARFAASHPGAAPITLVDEDLPPDALAALFAEADAAVLPTRGEGFNLPAAEAMAAGVPLIVTGHGGHMGFCGTGTARLLAHGFAPSGSHIAPPHSFWAEPDLDDLVDALREAAAGALAPLAAAARAAIVHAADPAALVARMADAAAAIMLAPMPGPVRIAWVSSWDVRCGVAEYSRTLLDVLPRDRLDVTILADDRTMPSPGVTAAWQAGSGGIERLLLAIRRTDAALVVVQHQPGLLPWPALGQLVDTLADEGRGTVVVLHNTSHLLNIDAAERAAALPRLARAARLLVHTLADVDRLHRLGLGRSTALLPHPAPAVVLPPRAVRTTAAPIVGCTGFFLPDKGIGALIAATALLRDHWPGIRLRLVNAEYPDPASSAEIAACRNAAAALGLAVEWHTGFLALDAQAALLADCDLLVLPYQRSRESSSAALRSAFAAGVAVATTPLPLFDEAGDAAARLAGFTPDALASGMGALLLDPDRRAALAAAAARWLGDRQAPAVATRLHGMLLGLAAQQHLGADLQGGLWTVPARA